MNTRFKHRLARLPVLALIAFAYFVVYSEDLHAVLAPLERILGLSNVVSPWLYGVIAVAIISWTILQIWRPLARSEVHREAQQS